MCGWCTATCSYAGHPVLVGHYAGDPILSAEAALDRSLGGVLSARHLLDLYPREVGTHEVVLPAQCAPLPTDDGGGARGALVVGLGDVGMLTPGGLSRTIENAVVRYARLVAERDAAAPAVRGQQRAGARHACSSAAARRGSPSSR